MKLLGLLPLASLAGIVLLDKNGALSQLTARSELAGFACLFASAFTLTLFVYEIRGILRSDGLIERGKKIEDLLNVQGQFWQCDEDARRGSVGLPNRIGRLFNTTVASCMVYCLVFAAWLFLTLRYAYGLKLFGCAISAVVESL